MKLIHCADLHLDAKMERHLDKDRAKERRGELLHNFERMVDFAIKNQVEAILIAGDLFDTKNISATVRNSVLHTITSNTSINFYYLKGNHDTDNFLSGLEEVPDNLYMFGSSWTSYEECQSKLIISGVELSKDNSESVYNSLILDSKKFNILMLHGQESQSALKDKAEIVNLKALKNRGIDYLALGHIHYYKLEKLDPRGIYCYPGCLEGRGFDECGEHGFVLLEYDENSGNFSHEFVPFAKRRLYEISVDVTDCLSTADMAQRVGDEISLSDAKSTDMVKIILTGSVDVESEKNVDYLYAKFKDEFYFVKCVDHTSLKINIDDFLLDQSLKGEYVRQVMSDESICDEDKMIIIRYGLQALAGEEIL